jgi:hypothetical protein
VSTVALVSAPRCETAILEDVVQLPSPRFSLIADPQPFHVGTLGTLRQNLLSHHHWNLEPPTPNEKDFWKSRIPARSGQIGIAQEVAGRAWHDGIPLQEQEECGQGTRGQGWFKWRRRIAVVLQQLEWPYEREGCCAAIVNALK